MATIEDSTLKIIDSRTKTTTTTVIPTPSLQRKTNINRKSARKEEDLSHYEQMVIMKKNPYLDLKELEQKLYNSGSKKSRASVSGVSEGGAGGVGGGAGGVAEVVGICDEGPYVEIINRGLSGFSIPTKLMKSTGAGESKAASAAAAAGAGASINDDIMVDVMITKKTDQEDKLLTNLVKDIKKFEETKLILY